MVEKISPRTGLELSAVRSVGKRLTHRSTEPHETKNYMRTIWEARANRPRATTYTCSWTLMDQTIDVGGAVRYTEN